MLRPELFSDIVNLIVSNAKAGKLCSEFQLEKMAVALTFWRNTDVSKLDTKTKLLWNYKRNTSLIETLKELGVTYHFFIKQYGGLKRDAGERGYWSFEDKHGVSILVKFSKYLTGNESLTDVGSRLGWSRQASQQCVTKIFGNKLPSYLLEKRLKLLNEKKSSVLEKKLHVQILKAEASLGELNAVATLIKYGQGKIQFSQRPEALLFKSLTGTFKLLRGQVLKGGFVVVDSAEVTSNVDFIVAYAGGSFYKSKDLKNPLISCSSKVSLTQLLSL